MILGVLILAVVAILWVAITVEVYNRIKSIYEED